MTLAPYSLMKRSGLARRIGLAMARPWFELLHYLEEDFRYIGDGEVRVREKEDSGQYELGEMSALLGIIPPLIYGSVSVTAGMLITPGDFFLFCVAISAAVATLFSLTCSDEINVQFDVLEVEQ